MGNSRQRRKQRRLRDSVESKAVNIAAEKSTEKKTPSLKDIFASRDRSIEYASTLMQSLPNPDPVLEAKNETIDVYNDLMYDSRVIATTTSRKSAVKAMEWDLVSEDQAAIDFHREYLDEYCMDEVIGEILDAPLYGYKPNEIMWLPDGKKVIPVDFVGKPPEWFVYDNENQLRMLTEEDRINGVEVPPNKFIVSRHEPTYKNPYGRAVLSACFWPVLFRRNGFRFLAVFVEKYGMPFLIGKVEAGTKEEEINDLLDMMDNLVQDGVGVVNTEQEIEALEGKEGKGKSDNLHKVFLDIMNNEIALAVLGNNLTTNVEGGSFAAATAHMEVRDDIIEADRKIVEGTFNELIQLTHWLNFGEGSEAPKFVLYGEEQVDKTRAERDQILMNGDPRFKFTEKYYEEKYGLDPEYFELTEEVESDGKANVVVGDE